MSIDKILNDRYFLKNEKSWDDIAQRISSIYPDIYENIKNKDFIPSSPTIMNLNTKGERQGTLSSCFPMEIEDSVEGIMDSMKECAIITKRGGGVGYDWSRLRGQNELVKGTGRNSGGILGFIGIFDAILDGISQGGSRRGAGMSMLNIYHPDILRFIDAKKSLDKYTRSNFSVKIPDSFYKTLSNSPDKIFKTRNVVDGEEIELKDNDGKTMTYKDMWDKVIDSAWSCAEPGIFNEDIAKKRATCLNVNENIVSNPCSEFTHVPYSSCNLGSINLSRLTMNEGDKVIFDWDKFKLLIVRGTIYLNRVIDNNFFPIDKIKEITLKVRPIGLGIMGLSHLLYKLGIPYDTEEAESFVSELMRYMTICSMRVSVDLAKTNKAYEAFDFECFMSANRRFFTKSHCREIDVDALVKDIKKYGCYNSSQTSIAPTGSISFIANSSSGIEPIFALAYTRKIEKLNKQYDVVYVGDPVFEDYIKNKPKELQAQIMEYVSKNQGSCQGCSHLTKDEQRLFRVAGDIDPVWHLRILAATANNISLSVSKTVNLPGSATRKQVADLYIKAHEMGVIGVTVYRDGCREGILNHLKEESDRNLEFIVRKEPPVRPDDLPCNIHGITVDGEEYLVLVGLLNGTLYEMFVAKNSKGWKAVGNLKHGEGVIRKIKSKQYDLIVNINDKEEIVEDIGSLCKPVYNALNRLVSLCLRSGDPLQLIVDQLQKSVGFRDYHHVVSRVLKTYIRDGEEVISGEVCPTCKSTLRYYDGCKVCNCGYGKCG